MKHKELIIRELQNIRCSLSDLICVMQHTEYTDGTESTCSICGKPEVYFSQIILEAGYGSKYDLERAILNVCGDCFDRLYEEMGCVGKGKPYLP